MVPKNTHEYEKFIKPNELKAMLEKYGVVQHNFRGITFNPIKRQWILSDDLLVNYISYSSTV